MSKTPQEAQAAWTRAVNAKMPNYMQDPPIPDQYESARESYARGSTTFEEFGRRVDELLARGL